jgi:hypothetical protein
MVVAPPAPVAWSPGTPPLTDALRARVLAGAVSAAERAVQVLPASGRRVVAVPMDTAIRRIIGEPASPSARRVVIPVDRAPGVPRVAPWGEPEPVPGVAVRTSAVPATWLQRPSVAAGRTEPAPAVMARQPRPASVQPVAHREPRPMPASVRIRKAAMMAFGLLVSLVAVEAAARVGRR